MSEGAVTEIVQQGISPAIPLYRFNPVYVEYECCVPFLALYEIITPPECVPPTLNASQPPCTDSHILIAQKSRA